MLNKFVVCLCLMVAVAMQSFVAVADSTNDIEIALTHLSNDAGHQFAQQGEHHGQNQLSKHHIANLDEDSSVVSDNPANDSQDDHSKCHHCGHCSTPHIIWNIATTLLTPIDASDNDFLTANFAFSSYIDNTYRPPIS